jgi:hypothetical protein
MATNLTPKQLLTLGELQDRPEELKMKKRQIEREIIRMEIKITDYKQAITDIETAVEKAKQDLADYENSLTQ